MNTDLFLVGPGRFWDLLRSSHYSPWLQLSIAVLLLLAVVVYKQLSEGAAIETGLYICYFWIPLCAILALFMADFWPYMMHWLLSTLAFFVIYCLAIYLCGKFGQPYMGDGGMVMLLPVYLFGFGFAATMLLYGGIKLFRFLFSF